MFRIVEERGVRRQREGYRRVGGKGRRMPYGVTGLGGGRDISFSILRGTIFLCRREGQRGRGREGESPTHLTQHISAVLSYPGGFWGWGGRGGGGGGGGGALGGLQCCL